VILIPASKQGEGPVLALCHRKSRVLRHAIAAPITNIIRRIVCIIFHSPAWQSEWVSGGNRYQIRCLRCGRVH
jgi:hypothetical protein